MSPLATIAALRHRVTLDAPGAAVSDNDGSYTQPFVVLSPSQVWADIRPATARDLERVAAGTVISTATHIVTMRYHPGVTTQTRLTKGPRNADGSLPAGSRQFNVTGVMNLEERNVELQLVCVEVVP